MFTNYDADAMLSKKTLSRWNISISVVVPRFFRVIEIQRKLIHF